MAATKRNGGCSGTHHRREDAADAPYVQAVVVVLVPDEELGALVVPRRDANVELRAWVVELGEAPVDQTQLRTVRELPWNVSRESPGDAPCAVAGQT